MTTLHRSLAAGACALALLSVFVIARPTRGAELVPPKTTERLFPRGVFCPFPFEVPFTTDGADITLRISTNTVNFFDNGAGEPAWSHQQIDNICIVSDEDYAAHHGPYSGDCYFGSGGTQFPVGDLFLLQDAGTIPLKELYAADGPDPASTGWDLTHGCSWNTTVTGPNDPGVGGDFDPKGCLDLGQFNPALALDDSAYTTRRVTGLTPKHGYRLTGWWNVQNFTFDLNQISLTVRIYGSDNPTPIVVRSWGALKKEYRDADLQAPLRSGERNGP